MIYCYSATGNTLYAAERIAKATRDTIARIGFDAPVVTSDNIVGLFFPTFFYGLPASVAELASALSLPSFAYVYCFITCGGSTGNAGVMLEKLLAKRGITLSARFDALMPDNFTKLYNAPEEAERNALLESADADIDAAEEKIVNRRTGNFQTHKGFAPAATSAVMYPLYSAFGRDTKRFYADDNCNACGLCVKVCPTHSLLVRFGKPAWIKPRCDGCLACLNRCPKAALQWGKATVGRRRYVHPTAFKNDKLTKNK